MTQLNNYNDNFCYHSIKRRHNSKRKLSSNRILIRSLNCTMIYSILLLLLLCISPNYVIDVLAQDNTSSSSSWNMTCNPYAMALTLIGKKYFKTTDGTNIPLKGIDYYPRPNVGIYTTSNSNDFYTEEFAYIWQRDIANFKLLNINAVRIYALNPGWNHDAFMCTLKEAGIYVIIGLAADCLGCAITGDSAPTCYPSSLKERGELIIKTFSKYDNVIGFDAGNEISLTGGSEYNNGPCQKQFLRDMRQYIQTCTSSNSMRHIPIGLAVADVDRDVKALYYNCRENTTDVLENAEYLGMNVYLHCTGGLTSIDDIVGFTTLLNDFTQFQLNIPVLLTEFGCISPSFPTIDSYNAQRDFLQVDALYNDAYEIEFAGGFVFEYNTELVNSPESLYPFINYGAGNFGVGYLSPIDCDDANISCSYIPFPQFDTLASKYGAVNMNKGISIDNYVPLDRTYPECPTGFPLLSSFTWPITEPMECPEDLTVICPNLPTECNTPTHPKSTVPGGSTPITTPVSSPTTTNSTNTTTTKQPTGSTTNSSAAIPTISPSTLLTTIETTESPTNNKNKTKKTDSPTTEESVDDNNNKPFSSSNSTKKTNNPTITNQPTIQEDKNIPQQQTKNNSVVPTTGQQQQQTTPSSSSPSWSTIDMTTTTTIFSLSTTIVLIITMLMI